MDLRFSGSADTKGDMGRGTCSSVSLVLLCAASKQPDQQPSLQPFDMILFLPGKSILGTKAKISGANLFMRLNYWVVYCGGQIMTAGPS